MSTEKPPGTRELLRALSTITTDLRTVDRWKVKLRPHICPFDDVLAHIPLGSSVFDIGCGSGQFAWLVAKYRRPNRVMGCEITPRLVDNARKLFADHPTGIAHEFEHFDGRRLPAVASTADVLVLIDVWHHVPVARREELIHSIVGSMKKGAMLIFKDIDADSPLVWANKFHDVLFGGGAGKEIGASAAVRLLSGVGLHVEEPHYRRMYVYPHYLLVAHK